MKGEFQLKADRLAVLIDADNAKASLIEPLLKEIAQHGTVHVKRIYGDWTDTHLNSWKERLNKFAIQPIQQFRYTSGKNATDSALIIDAMDLLYTQKLDGFCIVSSDSDFTKLACRIREAGLIVYGVGEQKTPEPFVKACDRFIYTEILENPEKPVDNDSLEKMTPELSQSSIKSNTDASAHLVDSNVKKLTIKQNRELVHLFENAYKASAREDGWADLPTLGSRLNQLSPSFSSKKFGYTRLRDLVRAIDLFTIKEVTQKNNQQIKDLYMKLRTIA